jgi:hypothetical protein
MKSNSNLNIYFKNPEFRKNLWLEITPLRMILMPALLLSFFYITWIMEKNPESVGGFAVFIFSIIAFLWGTRQTAESLASEIRDKTWDFQRMSSIRPWDMVWGKILGSASYQWIGILITSAVILAVKSVTYSSGTSHHPLLIVLFMIVAALTAQSISFLLSLQFLSHSKAVSKSGTFFFMLIGFTTGVGLMNFGTEASIPVKWYSLSFDRFYFTAVSSAVLLIWILAASYRLMRLQLKRRGSLLLWPFFILFLNLFIIGFFINSEPVVSGYQNMAGYTAVSVFINAALLYFMLLTEKKNPVILEAVFRSLRTFSFRRPDLTLPLWIFTLPFFIISIKIFFIIYIISYFFDPSYSSEFFSATGYMVYAAFFLVIRDLGIFIFYSLNSDNRRIDMSVFVTLVILYAIIPLIFFGADYKNVAAFFWPIPTDYTAAGFVFLPLQAAIATGLVIHRWRSLFEHPQFTGK